MAAISCHKRSMPGALEKDAPDHNDEVPQGVEQGEVLEKGRHVGNGEDQAREHDGRGQNEVTRHHRLLLGGGNRGDQQPQPHGTEEKGHGPQQQHQYLPRKGTSNHRIPTRVTRTTFPREMRTKGMVFPNINSTGRMGVTRICSMVPISFSRTTDRAVSIRLISSTTMAMTPGTME